MIKEIIIKNFQSHKYTKLSFSNGINLIVGSTDVGKSAIIRAIDWVLTNRPLGTNFVSFWARDDNSIQKECSVHLILDDNKEIIRRKGKDINEYVLVDNGKEIKFSNFGYDVPEKILEILNISDINVNKQHTPPFLLSQSSAEVSKYLNKIIRLDVIDTIFSEIESDKRQLSKEIKYIKEEIEEKVKRIEDLSWVERARRLSDRLDLVEKRRNENLNIYSDIEEDIYAYKENDKNLKSVSLKIEKAESIVKRVEKLIEGIENNKEKLVLLKEYVDDFKRYKQLISRIDIETIENKYNKLCLLREECKRKTKIQKELSGDVCFLKGCIITIKRNKENLISLKKRMPEICPLCGNKMTGGLSVAE